MDYELALYQQFYGDPPPEPPEYDDFYGWGKFDVLPQAKSMPDSGSSQPSLPGNSSHPVGCCLCLPYPPARACAPSAHTARIIASAYAGCASELSATMQYVYQSMLFASCYPEAGKTLSCIAQCEMHHLRLLGELLISLGCKPKYCASTAQSASCWWNASPACVHYATRLESALLDNISGEKQAIEFYHCALRQIDDENICLLLRRIILDEEHHIELFQSLYERCLR